ncbi:hypothetical protein SCHIN_v1c10100 [Spiroplasma chinense]|uniref:Uncharacterized protein n=1 Tax=Spiroplasma chinense TaxID=216932 RepID=A0A5B9Y5X3_9MOLU|nr:hypothetical protein [Spiroplasma chinense]QEH62203.1 hypothetical protein SCHIN_v1c10100 [Spiroplasma chinense]
MKNWKEIKGVYISLFVVTIVSLLVSLFLSYFYNATNLIVNSNFDQKSKLYQISYLVLNVTSLVLLFLGSVLGVFVFIFKKPIILKINLATIIMGALVANSFNLFHKQGWLLVEYLFDMAIIILSCVIICNLLKNKQIDFKDKFKNDYLMLATFIILVLLVAMFIFNVYNIVTTRFGIIGIVYFVLWFMVCIASMVLSVFYIIKQKDVIFYTLVSLVYLSIQLEPFILFLGVAMSTFTIFGFIFINQTLENKEEKQEVKND